MRKLTIPLFQLDELEPEPRARAIGEISEIYDPFGLYVGGFGKSINGFVEAMGLRFNRYARFDWSIDPVVDFNIVFAETYETNELNLRGRRLQKWLYNNFWQKITQGKYYSKVLCEEDKAGRRYCRSIFRESRVIVDKEACMFFGTVYDTYFTKPIIEFISLRNPNEFISIEGIIRGALLSGLTAFKEDIDYYKSDEGVSEYINVNDYEFLKDGTFYKHANFL